MDKTRKKVIEYIVEHLGKRFRTFDNTKQEKKVVAGQFPDIIVMRPEPPPNSDILFVMKVETEDSNLLDSVSEWKDLGSTPSVFYIIVPSSKLDDAKRLASATNIRARFGTFTLNKLGEVTKVVYE